MILGVDLANSFINRIENYTKYNVNIMNEKGIIIAASKEKDRIGQFHEISHNMIQNRILEMKTEPSDHHFLGTKYGMNMLLQYGREIIGVIGMTGPPEEVEPLLQVVKLALETMVDYETQHMFMMQKKNKQLRFMNTLLFSENPDELSLLEEQANSLGYSSRLYRMPVLISFLPGQNSAVFTSLIQSSQSASSQDIILTPAENEILIFKSLPQELDQMLENYMYIIGDLLSPLLNYTRTHGVECKIFVGSIHKEFINYRYGYRHCSWMRFYYRKESRNTYYFYNCLEDYLTYQLPLTELENIFSFFSVKLPADLKDSLLQLIPVLDSNGYNLNKASKELFIHKNTVIFRLNKLREYLSLDPIQNIGDRKFLYYLVYYLKRRI